MGEDQETPGGKGERSQSTSDQRAEHKERRLERQALRNDWPIPPATRLKILKRIVRYLDDEDEEGQTAPDRTILMAAKTLGMFANLTLKQQELDLKRKMAAKTATDDTQFGDALNVSDAIAAGEFGESDPAGLPPLPKQE